MRYDSCYCNLAISNSELSQDDSGTQAPNNLRNEMNFKDIVKDFVINEELLNQPYIYPTPATYKELKASMSDMLGIPIDSKQIDISDEVDTM